MEEMITVVSTYTTDLVPVAGGGVTTIPGGPANYIGAALRTLGVRVNVISGEKPTVHVIHTHRGEEYVIPRIPPIAMPPVLPGDACVLSPIVAEIPPESVPDVEGLLVVDLQGFVREPDKPQSEVQRLFDLEDLIVRSDVVKAAENELERLTSRSRECLSDTVLLVTRGADGAHIFDHGTRYDVPAEVVEAPHTIGAGDSYLAAFTLALLRGASPCEAGKRAASFTAGFLRDRAKIM